MPEFFDMVQTGFQQCTDAFCDVQVCDYNKHTNDIAWEKQKIHESLYFMDVENTGYP